MSQGIVHDTYLLDGFIARKDGKMCGLITYKISDDECEIITLDSTIEGCGIGTELINRVVGIAELHKCRRVWLITTNDNVDAIRFYQKRMFDLVNIHKNMVLEARKIKPQIPTYGYYGIEIKHELEFEYNL